MKLQQSTPKTCCDHGPVWILDTGGWHRLGGYLTHKRAKRCYAYVLFRSFTLREETKALWSPDKHEEGYVGKTHFVIGKVWRFWWLTDRTGGVHFQRLCKCSGWVWMRLIVKTTQRGVCGSAHASIVSYFESAVWSFSHRNRRPEIMNPEAMFSVSGVSEQREASPRRQHESDWVTGGAAYPIWSSELHTTSWKPSNTHIHTLLVCKQACVSDSFALCINAYLLFPEDYFFQLPLVYCCLHLRNGFPTALTLFTVLASETRRAFAAVGVPLADTRASVLTYVVYAEVLLCWTTWKSKRYKNLIIL